GGVEAHFVDADDAVIAIRLTERAAVVDDVPLARTGRAEHRMMPRAGRDTRILRQDVAGALEGSERRRPDRVRDRVVRTGPAAFGPHEVVLAVLHENPRALDVARRRDLLEHRPRAVNRHEAREVGIELRDVAVTPAAVDEVMRAAGIGEDEWIDRLRAVVKLV